MPGAGLLSYCASKKEKEAVIDVVTPDRYGDFRAQLKEMHRLRYRVFKERLKWDVDAQGGEERDQFDDCEPTYLLARDRTGGVVGSWRMLPTTGPYMLRDVFSALLEGRRPPYDPRIWEGSRFAVAHDIRARNGLVSPGRITAEVFCGVTEFCLTLGIREVLCVYELRVARILPLAGCIPQWQSRPYRVGNTIAVLGQFHMNARFLTDLQEHTGISQSVIQSAPWLEEEQVA